MPALETKPKQAGPLPGVLCMGLASFLPVLLCLISMRRSPGWGQGMGWAVFVILRVSPAT